MILHDLHCPTCNVTMTDFPTRSSWLDSGVTMRHWPCGTAMQIVSFSRHHRAAVHAGERAVIWRDASGKVSYPGQNDLPTPPGMERVEFSSFRELSTFCRDHNVRNELEGFDTRGSGRGFEYDGNPEHAPQWKEEIRWQ